ncbi:MAG: DUF4369 domain-containing protein [Alloprevotella sp.]|nr:DUF4369 domain-containing protein [Alloprevotella sp.]
MFAPANIDLAVRTFHHILTLILALSLASCAEEYKIAGKSTLPALDGKVLHLRATSGESVVVDIDSCRVVHGRFSFYGDVDTVCMAQIYMGTQNMQVPIVLETGDLFISMDNVGQRVTGSPLNDRLYRYINQQKRLYNEWEDLQTQFIKQVRKGKSPDTVQKKMAPKFRRNAEESEKLETRFIIDNSDNVLGPGYFMMLCEQYPLPVLTEQIVEILREASPRFRSHPFVVSYVRQAQMNPMSVPLHAK